jgi:hypothetical protein
MALEKPFTQMIVPDGTAAASAINGSSSIYVLEEKSLPRHLTIMKNMMLKLTNGLLNLLYQQLVMD